MINSMILGGIVVANIAAAFFFLKFWTQTKERLFLFFALAFLVEAAGRAILGAFSISAEHEPFIYLVRLAAYALILIAIIDYNRRPPPIR